MGAQSFYGGHIIPAMFDQFPQVVEAIIRSAGAVVNIIDNQREWQVNKALEHRIQRINHYAHLSIAAATQTTRTWRKSIIRRVDAVNS